MLRRGFLTLPVFFLMLAVAGAQEGKTEGKPATIKILCPDKPTQTEINIEGKDIKPPENLKDSTRIFETPPLEPNKNYAYTIKAVIVPNNYTKIFRTREVTFKAGETVTVDMKVENKEKDKIEVRWVPTPKSVVHEMCKLGKATKDDVVYDFGCGDCVMLTEAVKKFDCKKGVGIELKQDIIDTKAIPLIKKEGLEGRVICKQGDILEVKEKDCADATLVLLYIGDDLGARLGPVLKKALPPGARIVSHRFTLGDWKPEKTITIKAVDDYGEMDEYTLHLWVIPEKKPEEKKKAEEKKPEEKKKSEEKKKEEKK
jgi:uncharacterized protein (TIGR03000 family)